MTSAATSASFILAILGALLILVASIGVLRMPDLPTRMHASSKAGTLGAALLLLAVAVHSADFAVTLRALLICVFLFLTAPVAAHIIARAAYRSGVPLSEDTVIDELRDQGFSSDGDSSGTHDAPRQ